MALWLAAGAVGFGYFYTRSREHPSQLTKDESQVVVDEIGPMYPNGRAWVQYKNYATRPEAGELYVQGVEEYPGNFGILSYRLRMDDGTMVEYYPVPGRPLPKAGKTLGQIYNGQ